jgi:acetyltransferase-like isoleucine patch superfamily enzyme
MSPIPGVKVHRTALVESDSIGSGTTIWAFVHIMHGAVVGLNCKIGDHAFIEGGAVLGDRVTVKNNALIWHGVTIGDDVFVGPNAVFTNDLMPRAHRQSGPEDWLSTTVGHGATIGANSTVVCGVTIGRHSMIGAGTVVTKDVAPFSLVVGNPGKAIGWACICGARLGRDQECGRCGRSYRTDDTGLVEMSNA